MIRAEAPVQARPPILTVEQLTYGIKDLLERQIGQVLVRGELSGVRFYASGHLYFTLKDAQAQICGVMWQSRARRLPFRPVDGMRVIVAGLVTVYPPRGQYQLVADGMRLEGAGDLQAAFAQLKARLQAEGLFADELKRPIPRWPRSIALVTSPDGAALRDLVRVIHQRAPWVRLVLCPTLVQGAEAPARICAALALANRTAAGDLIILARGGGSLEDLWAFNDEGLARAIRASRLPVVSAVGHETDWTIADLVADLRVATPSHAGMLVPDGVELGRRMRELEKRLAWTMRSCLRDRRLALLERARRLEAQDPRARVKLGRQRLVELGDRLRRSLQQGLAHRRARLSGAAGRLDALSPLAVLGRGYALVRKGADGPVVRDPAELVPEERLYVRVARGSFTARVEDLPEKTAG